MTRDLDVLVVGDANPDLILRGDVVPRFGQSEQLLEGADLTIGGSGAIVAHGLARLGLRTALVAMIGDDQFGVLTRNQLATAGVEVGQLRIDDTEPTGLSVILAHGDTRTTLTLVGAIATLDPASVGAELLARARHVHASSFFLQPRLAAGLADLFLRARAAGATTSLDTNLDPAGRWDGLDDVLPVTDVLLPNRTEILALARRYQKSEGAGTPIADASRSIEDDATPAGRAVVAAAQVIAALGPLVVVKDGAQGAVAVHPCVHPGAADVIRQPGYPVAAVDSTGAGDSFDAGFLAAWTAGAPLAAALAIGCRAGALSTLGIGGTTTQATAAQVRLDQD